MKSFSQRRGLKPAPEVVQSDGMTDELRIGLWNVFHLAFWSRDEFVSGKHNGLYREDPELSQFATRLWFHHLKRRIDQIPTHAPAIIESIRKHFFGCTWSEVYDFVEFVVNDEAAAEPGGAELTRVLNAILERELSAYRIVDGQVVDITSDEEVEMLHDALADDSFSGVAAHLRRAVELYADRKSPDYRNSIKESISAVEAMARIVAGTPKRFCRTHSRRWKSTGSCTPRSRTDL